MLFIFEDSVERSALKDHFRNNWGKYVLAGLPISLATAGYVDNAMQERMLAGQREADTLQYALDQYNFINNNANRMMGDLPLDSPYHSDQDYGKYLAMKEFNKYNSFRSPEVRAANGDYDTRLTRLFKKLFSEKTPEKQEVASSDDVSSTETLNTTTPSPKKEDVKPVNTSSPKEDEKKSYDVSTNTNPTEEDKKNDS